MLIFGSIGLFVKAIPLPSAQIVLARTVIGGAFLLLLRLASRRPPNYPALLKNLPFLLLSGLALGLGWILLFEAYRYTSVSIATLAYYCAPVLVLLLSPLLLKESLSRAKLAAVLAAMIGMAWINDPGSAGFLPDRGLLCGLAAAVLYAALMLVNKFIKDLDGLDTTLFQMLVVSILMTFYVFFTYGTDFTFPEGSGLAALLTVGIFHTGLGCCLYFSSLQMLPAQNAALLSYIDPLSALLFSAGFLDEKLSALQWCGAALILGGAAFGQFHKKQKHPEPTGLNAAN